MNVIYDTGSDWLTIEYDFCTNCIAPVFNTSASTTYSNKSSSSFSLSYGSASLTGYSALDTVALASSQGL